MSIVAGAFACWRVSRELAILYVVVMSVLLDLFFRFKYGRGYWREPRRLFDLIWFSFGGALFGSVVLQMARVDGAAAPFTYFSCVLGGISCGVFCWYLLFVDRKGGKNE